MSMAFRTVRTIAMALGVALPATGCVFEACCLRPSTGVYDVCIAAAVPRGPAVEAPRVEAPAPTSRPAALAR